MVTRIAVLGAGAIGASIGAYLIRAGHDVTLIDQWAAHVESIKKGGLKVTDLNGEFTVRPRALHLGEVSSFRELFDVAFLSVKLYDTRWSTYFLEPLLKPSGFVLPAMNGMPDELVASIVGFNRTVGCVPGFSAGLYEPGRVIRTDPLTTHCFSVGELSGIVTPRVKEVADSLAALGPSEVTTNIWGDRWNKMVINCMFNALSGLLGASALTKDQKETAALIRILVGCEAVQVTRALSINFDDIYGVPVQEFAEAVTMDDIKRIKDKFEALVSKRLPGPEQIKRLGQPGRPSLLQDIIKGRRTEVEYLNGYLIRKAKKVGVPTPMNEAILGLAMKLETRELKSDPSNLELLKPYLNG